MMSRMTEDIGRREANKRATTRAIEHAARDLFAAKGYEATSVREIADAAGVAERTFYRYFDGKEGLLTDEVERWIRLLSQTIRNRPVDEPPFAAVHGAVAEIAHQVSTGGEGGPIWLFTNQPRPFELLQKSAPRPLLRFEDAIANALLSRATAPDDPEARYHAETIARISVALIRSVAIRRRELIAADPSLAPPVEQMLQDAFTYLATVISPSLLRRRPARARK